MLAGAEVDVQGDNPPQGVGENPWGGATSGLDWVPLEISGPTCGRLSAKPGPRRDMLGEMVMGSSGGERCG